MPRFEHTDPDLLYLAGCALTGMLSNPQWTETAQKEASVPGSGDVPEQFAKLAARYAQRTLKEINRIENIKRR